MRKRSLEEKKEKQLSQGKKSLLRCRTASERKGSRKREAWIQMSTTLGKRVRPAYFQIKKSLASIGEKRERYPLQLTKARRKKRKLQRK